VLGRMAIMGQSTVFYAAPNAGRTLMTIKLLTERIVAGNVDGTAVFYINADDTYKGLVQKRRICEEYGFNLLAPGHNGFKPELLAESLRTRIALDMCNGTVVILDTLKKFTDLMNKRISSDFGNIIRAFVSNGGTTISLGHVNKHKNEDGLSDYQGTTDIIDDADCAYIIDVLEDNGELKTVKFRNIKDRGDVVQSAMYSYKSKENRTEMPYSELFHSVKEVSPEEAKNAAKRQAIADKLALNHECILHILSCINGGVTQKTDLVKEAADRAGKSQQQIRGVLAAHEGTDRTQGHRWAVAIGGHNAKTYSAL